MPEICTWGSREHGEKVVDHRSSWVRRMASPSASVYVKTYEYATWKDRCGNWGKHTAPWRASRASNEYRALTWLRARGFAAPHPLACLEWRQLGFVSRAVLVTAAYDGAPADRVLAEADAPTRAAIAKAIGSLVVALHRLGFRDRNLDLRNLLVRDDDGAIIVAKIDSPRFRLVRPGRTDDRLARADWQRLLPQLHRFDVADDAHKAVMAASRSDGS